MITNTAKLQEKIMALTNIDGSGGVDILTKSGDFKSTYDILLGISKVWDKMGDVEQAALLELVAGKTRGSVVAALFQNGDVLEDAYKSASDASGSAMRELENHLDSIQGRIDLFNNALQTMWMNLINSEVIKGVVDAGTTLVKFFDTAIGKITTLGAVIAGLKFKNNLKKDGIDILGYIFDVAPEKIKNSAIVKDFGDIFKSVRNEALKNVMSGTSSGIGAIDMLAELANFDDASEILQDIAGAFSLDDNNVFSKAFSKDQVKEVLDGFDNISDATKDAILNSNLFTVSQTAAAAGTGVFTGALAKAKIALVAFKDGLMAFAAAHPIIAGLTVALIALGAVAAIADAVIISHDEYIEKLEEETEALKSVQSELQNVQSELEKTQERIDELNAKGTLSFVEEEELNRLKQQTAELERQEAILAAQEKRTRDQQISTALNALKTDPNFKTSTPSTVGRTAHDSQANAASQQAAGAAAAAATEVAKANSKNKYESTLDSLKEAKEDLEKANTEFSKVTASTDEKEYNKLKKNVEEAKKRVKTYNSTIDSMNEAWQKEYGEISYVENATTEEEKAWNEYYRQHQDYLDQQALINNDYGKDVVLDRIFGANGTDIAKKFKKEFEDAVNSDKDPSEVIEGMFENADYSNAFSGLEEQFGITIDNIKAYFTQEGEFTIDPVFDINKYSHDIKSHSAVISEFQDAMQSLEKGTFTMDDFLDLIERFPDLAKGVDISSKSFYGLSRNLNKAIKSRTKSFINDLKALRKSLDAAGKSTASIDQLIESIENMPDDSLDDTIERYSTLAKNIDKARTAQDRLLASMEENPNQGYESRGDAIEYMKEAMKNGEIGSESNLWNVAERYGFTYDSAKSINENADALAKYIATREDWFKQNDDGDDRTDDGYSFKGTENFIKDVEAAVQANAELQSLLTWDYDEDTGTFNFDFDNKNWDKIIEHLSKSKELIGLTSDEWSDMLIQVGQYFAIKWGNADDIRDHILEVANSSMNATTKIDLMTASVETYVEKALGTDLDFSSLTYASINALDCDDSIKKLLRTYLTLKQTLEDPMRVDPLGLNNQNTSITTLMSSLSKLGVEYEVTKGTLSEPVIINIAANDLITELREKGWDDEKISTYLQTLSESAKTLGITIDGKVRMNQEEIDAAIAKSEEIPEEETMTVVVDDTQFQVLESRIDAVDGREIDLYTNIHEKTIREVEDKGSTRIPLNNSPSNIFSQVSWTEGTAHAEGSWGASRTETALTGELGPEILVRNGRWTTVGENGAEFTQVKKGDIIFNHKQSEQLLKNGYVTGRGKLHGGAFASGTAFVEGDGTYSRYEFSGSGGYREYDVNGYLVDSFGDLSGALSDAADSVGEFEETIDWIEIRMEELDEVLGLYSAHLENAATYDNNGKAKNDIINDMINVNKDIAANANAGAEYYKNYAEKYLVGMSKELADAARNGAISITEFTKEQDEATVKAIQNYRDFAQKSADLTQKAVETIAEIRNLAIQKIDNFQDYGSAKTNIEDLQTEKLQNMVDYLETKGEIPASAYYGTNGGNAASSTGMFENSYKKKEYWSDVFDDMQKAFDEAVQTGRIQVGTVEWYEQIAKLYEVQAEIDAATIEIEEFQNAINDLYWENFDQLINRIGYLKDETQSLIDLMDHEDMVITPETEDGWGADDVKWTEEGLASLGLYAQQMEIAEYTAKQYAEAIDDLTKDYKSGLYSENEYLEKLNELKSAQYDSIEAYYDAQDVIRDLQEARVDAIKNGIEKEVDAYEKLINKKKESLSAEKDLHDFQKQSAEQSKNIAQIERQLAALANDHSMAAMAKKRQLEAELAEAKAEQEELYYDRSIENQQTALDKELDSFKEQKDAEIQKWDEYLENVELLVTESLGIVQENATGIGQTLTDKANEYNLTVSDAITKPWADGSLAVSDYQTTFDTAMSSTMDQLEALKASWQGVIDKMVEAGNASVNLANKQNTEYAAAKKQEVTSEPVQNPPKQDPPKDSDPKPANTRSEKDYYGVALAIWQDSAYYGWGRGKTGDNNLKAKGFDPYKVQEIINKIGEDGYIRNGSWRGKYHGISDLSPYHINRFAKGTTGVDKDQWALIDELGDELVMHASGGKLTFLTKGSAVIPHDISENLMTLGSMDPQDMLDRNRPAINAPHIVNNEININMNIAEVVHVDRVDHDTLPDLTKAVRKEMDSYMSKVNNAIRSKVR